MAIIINNQLPLTLASVLVDRRISRTHGDNQRSLIIWMGTSGSSWFRHRVLTVHCFILTGLVETNVYSFKDKAYDMTHKKIVKPDPSPNLLVPKKPLSQVGQA